MTPPTSHLSEAAALYGASEASFEKLGAFESDVYAFSAPDGPAILKVIDPGHRTPEQVAGEVEWLLALRAEGLPVSQPLASVSGAWVERLEEPGKVLVAFRRAPGTLTKPQDWTEERVEAWGALLGRLQAHSRTFVPEGPRRQTLLEHSYLNRAAEAVPEDPDFVRAAAHLAEEASHLLAYGPDSGLIHADLHSGNVLLDGERWTAIDFDDCGYGSYAFDLAMPIYYALRNPTEATAEEAASRFVPPFLRGLRRHAEDPAGGAHAVALSLMLREAELVMALRIKLPEEDWTERLRGTEQRLRANVKAGRPVLDDAVLARWLG